ncbi:aberrant root formation protein 4 [Physcomitrium patens]|uniref:Uncharacterized protein n=2 Tax=Physcomitrium patens TaxID=3218 RepID=A0A2K1K7E8_PHYPA|nr:aberrant root formation protein 4-like [Physcomitrium patens]XP_024383427.1 aberrant root formation protein 4-like [Physcomitrium patens]PNR49698.1 hypothetical protein PHYPA_011594 [Physcomitrium patens]|eukprot:XP_024383426.1 aberrant root formation protein 4-like [Physcomitrella patens]
MAAPLLERLSDAALRCCQDEQIEDSERSAREFLDLLESPLHDLELRKSSPANWLAQCDQVLQQAVKLLDPSSLSGLPPAFLASGSTVQTISEEKRVLCERVGLDLPKVVVKFVSLSQACQDHSLSIIEILAENCSPREMFAAFMEALNMYTTPLTLIYCIPLIQGLSLVFSRLQRRQAQFFQEASEGLLTLLRSAAHVDDDDEEEEDEEFVPGMEIPLKQVHAAILDDIVEVAQVVRETCDAVHFDEHREAFQQQLGMFVLQILGIVGEKIAHSGKEVPPVVIQLVELLPFCGLSVLLLLTGDQIKAVIEITTNDVTGCGDELAQVDQKKLEATKGSALAAYWALSTSQVAAAAEITLDSLKEGLQFTGRKGIVAALSVATSLLGSSSHRPLSLMPATGLALVDKVLELAASLEFCTFDEEEDDDLDLTLRILPALQSLQNVVVYAPSIEMRRQGYALFKKVIEDVLPETSRFKCLQKLINDCIYPSLVSLHLICMKDEVVKAWPRNPQQQGEPNSAIHLAGGKQQDRDTASHFLKEEILEVIGSVLRPKNGAPPDLPAQIDPVQSAVNLYRFILIRESSGKTNYTGVLSKENLAKARSQWLLPLREVMEGLSQQLREEDGDMSADMGLAIDSLQSVVYRCLELNEEALAYL